MRTKLIASLALLGIGLCLHPIALAGPPVKTIKPSAKDVAAAHKEIETVMDKEKAAVQRKDVEGILACYAPDYQETSVSGAKHNRNEIREMMKMALASLQNVKSTGDITKFTLLGNKALVSMHGKMMWDQPAGPQSKVYQVAIEGTSDDIWVKGSKGWLKQRSKNLGEKKL